MKNGMTEMNDIELSIALLYKKKGTSSLSEKDFVFAASIDYRWLTPKGAQKLLDVGLESNLLKSDDGMISPTFDYKSSDIPAEFKPTLDMIRAKAIPKGILFQIADKISKGSDRSTQDVIAIINKKQEALDIDIEVAALIVANSMNIDISDILPDVDKEIKARYS